MPGTDCNDFKARNLSERIKIPQLIEALREIFEEYGTIVDIVAKSSLKRKGQAFIVFDSVQSAENAIDEVNGFELFGQSMSLDFARTRSDATVQREGTAEELEQHKRHRKAEKGEFVIVTGGRFWILTCMYRTQASPRGSRSSQEPQATSTRCSRARCRCSARSQDSTRSRSQGYIRCRCRSRARRIPPTKQDSVHQTGARRLRSRCPHSHLLALCWLQGGPYCAWSQGHCFRRV
jgi:RNA recognition motif-containing protein